MKVPSFLGEAHCFTRTFSIENAFVILLSYIAHVEIIMKRQILMFLIALYSILSIVMTGCVRNQAASEESDRDDTRPVNGESNILVAYFSRSGNTENVAKMIAGQTGGTLLKILPAKAYPSDYNTLLDVARNELNENARPAISFECSVDMTKYDTVFLGFPLWHAREPMIINTFLESYNFEGKRIVPFSTSASSDAASAYSALQTVCPNADFLTGRNFTSRELSNAKTIISEWFKSWDVGKEAGMNTLYIKVGETTLTATLADNSSVKALKKLLSENDLTIEMSDYGNFEKVGLLGVSLPRNDEQITTMPGDLILYQGNSFVIYYDTNSWNFTRMGKIENVTRSQLIELLGEGDVTVTLSLNE